MSKAASRTIAASAETKRVRSALEALAVGWLCVDAGGRVVDHNAAAADALTSGGAGLDGRLLVEVLVSEGSSVAGAAARDRLAAECQAAARGPVELSLRREEGFVADARLRMSASEEDGRRTVHCFVQEDGEPRLLEELALLTRRLDESQRIAGVGSWEWDIPGDTVIWTAEQRRIFGVDQDLALSYASFAERVHPEDRERVEEIVRAAVRTAEPLVFESRIVRPDGEVRWISVRGEVHAGLGGQAVRMAGTVRDVTEAREVRACAAAADARFHAVFEHSPLGVVLLSPADGVSRVNPAAETIFGCGADALAGRRMHELACSEDSPRVERLIGDLQRSKRDVVRGEFAVARADGQTVAVQMTAVMVAGDAPYVLCQLQDVTERRAAESRLALHAEHDPLTGLLAREPFCHRIDATLAHTGVTDVAAVLLVGLDAFRHVNDGLGHVAGDLVLQETALRLKDSLRRGDVLARFGGDEFAVLLRELGGGDDAIAIATSVGQAFEAPFAIQGVKVHVGASIGIAVAPQHGYDGAELLQKADVAMTRAKALRSDWAIYHADEDTAAMDRLSLAGDLREALERDELEVAYQPIVETRTGHVVAIEALARWTHPERGAVGPDQFVALAEQVGLIIPLTEAVLRKALAACAHWRARGHDVRLAVNLSVRVLSESADLPAMVTEHLTAAGVRSEQLIFEITESALAENDLRMADALAGLRAIGVTLVIDDFGTGYSAMSYLKHLPVEELKIDRSFVRDIATDPRDLAIVRSLVRLAHSLDLRVVAEGVESRDAIELLDNIGCDLMQGYGIARPMPARGLTAWLTTGTGPPQRPSTGSQAPKRPSTGSQAPKRPAELLVIDDSAAVRAVVADRTTAAGWTVHEAITAEDGIAAVRASLPDVIILDQELPGMSGVQAIPHIREHGYEGPILLFTRFLSDAMPGIRVPLDVWPVSKDDLDGMLALLAAYRASLR